MKKRVRAEAAKAAADARAALKRDALTGREHDESTQSLIAETKAALERERTELRRKREERLQMLKDAQRTEIQRLKSKHARELAEARAAAKKA